MNPSTPTSNRLLQRSLAIYACITSLSCLVVFNVAIFVLQAMDFFEKHRFDISKISAVSQITSITMQACTVIILVALSYAMQLVASDTIIRRGQSLAALHETLAAWRGLTSSIIALLTNWDLDVRTWFHILLAFMFFGVVSALHIITPSVITIGTFNATLPISLTVSTWLNITPTVWVVPNEMYDDPLSIISYLWPQLGTNTNAMVGLPLGTDGSVLFSTLPSIMTQDVIFEDPHARDISVRCGIIPRALEDSFNVSYTGAGASPQFQNDSSLIFNITLQFEPTPGDPQRFLFMVNIPMSSGFFTLGGNKESMRAHPVFSFNDVLIQPFVEDLNGPATTFAYISTQSDGLKLNPSIGFAPPVQHVLRAQTWSFVDNDIKNAFHEEINITFYIWPIGCSMFSQNITAQVRGDNVLLQKSSPLVPAPNPTPFIHSKIPDDPWEANWPDFITLFSNDRSFLMSSSQFLTPFQLQLLSGLNSTNDSLALLGERLATASSLSCALLLQFWCSSTSPLQPDSPWTPVWVNASGLHSVILAGLVVQTQPLVAGLILCSILIFVFIVTVRQSKSSDNLLQDGQVISLISLLHNSSLPTTIITDVNKDIQRLQAVHTHVLYDSQTLDIDHIQTKQHAPSLVTPLVTLDTVDSQYEDSSNLESMQGSSSTSIPPGLAQQLQSGQSPQRVPRLFTSPWSHVMRYKAKFTSVQSYLNTYRVTVILLASFYVTIIVLWFTHKFDDSQFDIKRLGHKSQLVSLLGQAWAVVTISVITFTVQAIVSDLAIQQRQTVAALQDTLGGWLGMFYAIQALIQNQDHFQTRLQLVLTLVFFISISLLHISTPSVITVHAVNATKPSNLSVITMPGNLAHIAPSAEAQNDLAFAIEAIPFLWDERNSGIGLPMGYNGMTLFSTLERPTLGDVVFEDLYAHRTVVECRSFPHSTLNIFNITYYPSFKPDPSVLGLQDWLTFDLQLVFPLSHTTSMMFRSNPDQWTVEYEPVKVAQVFNFSFSGGKESKNVPPHYWMNDLLVYLPHQQSNINAHPESYNMGTIALAYVSLHPDAFQLNSVGSGIPPVVDTEQFQVWSWIGNSSWASGPIELEQVNATFYIWPILCSLSVHNVTAWVHSDGDTRLERTNFNTPLENSTTPLIKGMVPSDPMVTSWSYIVDLLFSETAATRTTAPSWLEYSLNQTWSLTSLEDSLSDFAAFYYSVLVQHWRTNGNPTSSQWWSEGRGSVAGTQLVLFGRLDISPFQLILGCACVIAMIITSAVSMLGLRTRQGAVMDGSVMDMISLLRGSSLPGIIAGENDEDLGRDGRRRRAERTMIMYKNSILDVPERLQDADFPFDSEAHEMTGLQSSLRTITPAGHLEENIFINSGDHEATAVDLQNPTRTITLPESPEDEHLLINSEERGTTGFKRSLRTITRTSSGKIVPAV